MKNPVAAALQLTRPAQWPILSAQLLVSFLLAAPAWTNGGPAWLQEAISLRLAAAWLAWVVLLNGGTLAYNSAYDRDTGPVAYLRQPPLPPDWLARAAAGALLLAVVIGLAGVGAFFGGVVGICAGLSMLYSHPATRWKSIPGIDLLTNVVGYGAGTTLAGLSAAGGGPPALAGWWMAAGFGLLFGSFYPLTQVYQTEADRHRGDRTLATALGITRSLVLSEILGLAAGMALGLGCSFADRTSWLALLVVVCVAWLGHLEYWRRQARSWDARQHERGMYRALGLWAAIDVAVAAIWLRG